MGIQKIPNSRNVWMAKAGEYVGMIQGHLVGCDLRGKVCV